MLYSVNWLNVDAYLHQNEPPTVLMPRKPYVRFWTPQTPLLGQKISWSLTKQELQVRIPIFAYRTHDSNLVSILGTGLQLGFEALDSLLKETNGEKPQGVHLLLGRQCHPLVNDFSGEQIYRFYLGLSFLMES